MKLMLTDKFSLVQKYARDQFKAQWDSNEIDSPFAFAFSLDKACLFVERFRVLLETESDTIELASDLASLFACIETVLCASHTHSTNTNTNQKLALELMSIYVHPALQNNTKRYNNNVLKVKLNSTPKDLFFSSYVDADTSMHVDTTQVVLEFVNKFYNKGIYILYVCVCVVNR